MNVKSQRLVCCAPYLALVGVGLIFLSSGLSLVVQPSWMGPGFMPGVCGAAMIIMAVVGAVSCRKSAVSHIRDALSRSEVFKAMALFMGCAAYLISMTYVGFPLTTVFLVVATVRYAAKRTWKYSFISGLCMTAAAYFIFQFLLETGLPELIL